MAWRFPYRNDIQFFFSTLPSLSRKFSVSVFFLLPTFFFPCRIEAHNSSPARKLSAKRRICAQLVAKVIPYRKFTCKLMHRAITTNNWFNIKTFDDMGLSDFSHKHLRRALGRPASSERAPGSASFYDRGSVDR